METINSQQNWWWVLFFQLCVKRSVSLIVDSVSNSCPNQSTQFRINNVEKECLSKKMDFPKNISRQTQLPPPHRRIKLAIIHQVNEVGKIFNSNFANFSSLSANFDNFKLHHKFFIINFADACDVHAIYILVYNMCLHLSVFVVRCRWRTADDSNMHRFDNSCEYCTSLCATTLHTHLNIIITYSVQPCNTVDVDYM